MAGLRFAGSALHHGWRREPGGVTGGWGGGTGSELAGSTFMMTSLEKSRVYIAPARYSDVRRVTFSITFRHEQAGGTLATTFSGRIGPSSSSATARVLETANYPVDTHERTVGAGTQWSVVNPTADGAFYPLTGNENQIAPRQVIAGGTSDAQTLTVDFVRGEAASAAFFADWDAAAALTDDDYVAYWPGIQRNDLNPFTTGVDLPPIILGMGIAVVQAPSPENNCCTQWPASVGLRLNSSIFNLEGRSYTFTYNADDWDNIDSITALVRQTSVSGPQVIGQFQLQVLEIADQSAAVNAVYTQTFTPGSGGADTWIMRTSDFKSSLVDGRTYILAFVQTTGAGQVAPWAWWEVTQKDCTKKTTFHTAGQGNADIGGGIIPSVPPPDRWALDQSLFDPSWYEEYPTSLILRARHASAMQHINIVNNTDQAITVNPDLGADIPNSAGNSHYSGVSSTPDATSAFKVRFQAIQDPDPITLTDPMVFKQRYGLNDWNSNPNTDLIGGDFFAYTFEIPASDVLDLGPLFALGAFDPEGCASTAAGLGDNPGVLVLTNGGTTPKKFNPIQMVVQNAGIDPPFREQEPTVTIDSIALSPDGGLTPGIYTYRYTLRNSCTQKESNPNPVDIVVDASGESPAAEVTFDFSGVVIPGDSQIDQICVYRTVEGGDFPVMAKVGCFDVGVTSVFVDSLSDSVLDFVNDGLSILNGPMPCVPVVEEFRNRLWAMGDIPNLNPPGTVAVTEGSDIVEGDSDTDFDRCILGRHIQIQGDCTQYEVTELLAPDFVGASPLGGTRLKLDREYEGTTDSGLNYIICGHPNRLYISEPLEPECWPEINFLDIDPGDGDRLMGANSNFNRLLVCKRRKTYVVAFREQPVTEIIVPTLIGRDIGCISARSFAQIASGTVWLSDRGLALYDGRGVSAVPESSVMNDLFVNPDNPNYLRRDENGRAIGAAGVFYPKREQYLLLLPTVKTTRGASLVLVWDTELRNITLLEFCQEFLSIEVAKDADGNERVYLGDANGFVWIWDVGDTDGIGFPNATGTVRGTVTAAGLDATGASFLEDMSASFIAGGVPGIADLSGVSGFSGFSGQSNMGIAGSCVFWRPANSTLDTPWQSRFIYATTKTRMYVTPNWGNDTPSVGDEYMLGPIEFRAQFKPANYGTDDFTKRDWRQIIVHEREAVATNLRTELLRDFQNSDVDEDTVTDSAGETGEGRNYDLSFGQGRQIRPVGRLIHNFMGVRLSNFAPEEPLTIINHVLGVIPERGK